MGDHILNHLGELLEVKNRTIRKEAVDVFSTYCITDSRAVQVFYYFSRWNFIHFKTENQIVKMLSISAKTEKLDSWHLRIDENLDKKSSC